jgi:hypothetical protein
VLGVTQCLTPKRGLLKSARGRKEENGALSVSHRLLNSKSIRSIPRKPH